jgi:hypothetical protein
MKVINSQPPIPFTERMFTVEMTGAELAFVKAIVRNCIGNQSTVRNISDSIDGTLIDSIDLKTEGINIGNPWIDCRNNKLTDFLEKVNRLNK